ncbi:hypothetical protein AAFF_G00307480 [Aldrovandia affinis]|uniref:Ig-like domain-containing protein n=1 Tax=Aldrovandia affinis TaxID=143900 RepID=A0AAD7R8P7_9TELE|nr:hypothetical protein AAFF_G00307480 [Aldrovandia affinis]
MFQLTVYSTVSTPQIRLLNPNPDHVFRPQVTLFEALLQSNSSCSVLCSVENGREVTLSWQREGEMLSHTCSTDLNISLSLPLEIEDYNSTYSCVAENPVSNQTVPLNTEEFCPRYSAPTPMPQSRRKEKRKRVTQQSSDGAPVSLQSPDVDYKSVRIKPRSSPMQGNQSQEKKEERERNLYFNIVACHEIVFLH